MDLRSALSFVPGLAWLGRSQRAASAALPFTQMGSEYFGPGIGNQPTADVLLRESTGPFDSACRAIANRLSELELLVKVRRRTRAGTVEDEELDDHPLKALLDKPHPNIPRSMWLWVAARHVLTSGQCLWQKVGNRLGVPVELHWMKPGMVEPLVDAGVLIGWLVTDGHGRQHRMPADVIVRCWFPDPENPWGAEGYLSPTGIAADAHKFAMQHVRFHYQHDATPKGVIETTEETEVMNADARRRFEAEWESRYHSRQGTVRSPAILGRGLKYTQIKHDSREGIVPLLEYERDDLLMATATPRSVLGQVVSGDRSSAEVNQWVFDRYAVSPIANLIASGLTLQLAPDFDEKLIVCFEDFVGEDKEFRLKEEAHDIEHAIRTPNKVLTDRGDDETEWGDQAVISSTLGVYDPEAALELMKNPPVPPGGSQDNGEEMSDEEAERAERREHAAIGAKWRERRRRKKRAA